MDYEQKYKEALERAKIWQNHLNESGDKDYADELEYIFPELCESEDEKIRGKVIATIHLYYGEPLEDEAKEMITWLEKQGEQNKIEALRTEYEKGRADTIAEMESSWSEEDDKMLSDAIGAIGAADYYTYDDKQAIEDWLKSLKQRIGE